MLSQQPYVVLGSVCFLVTYVLCYCTSVNKTLSPAVLNLTLSQFNDVDLQHSVETMTFLIGVENSVEMIRNLIRSHLIWFCSVAEKNKSCLAGKRLIAKQQAQNRSLLLSHNLKILGTI